MLLSKNIPLLSNMWKWRMHGPQLFLKLKHWADYQASLLVHVTVLSQLSWVSWHHPSVCLWENVITGRYTEDFYRKMTEWVHSPNRAAYSRAVSLAPRAAAAVFRQNTAPGGKPCGLVVLLNVGEARLTSPTSLSGSDPMYLRGWLGTGESVEGSWGRRTKDFLCFLKNFSWSPGLVLKSLWNAP